MSKLGTTLRYSLGVALAGGSGVLLALALGSAIRAQRPSVDEARKEEQRRQTAEILEEMNTIAVGDRLPDHLLMDPEQNPLPLSEMVDRKTLIIFFEPSCGGCRYEMQELSRVLPKLPQSPPLVMISAADREQIEEVRFEFQFPHPILHDEDAALTQSLRILAYPFNVIVDENMVIRDVIAGALPEEELLAILQG